MQGTKVSDSWRSVAGSILLVVAVLWLVVANSQPGASAREILLATIQRSGQAPPSFVQIDDLFENQLPTGNIWLQFEGFKPQDEGMMTAVYYRGNYIIYPRRIYVADPATVINNGQPIILAHESFSDLLAANLEIEWKVTFFRNTQGRIDVKVDRV